VFNFKGKIIFYKTHFWTFSIQTNLSFKEILKQSPHFKEKKWNTKYYIRSWYMYISVNTIMT
jgi:hypothetical protein